MATDGDGFVALSRKSVFHFHDLEGNVTKSLKSQIEFKNVVCMIYSEVNKIVCVQWNNMDLEHQNSSKVSEGRSQLCAIDIEATNEGKYYTCDIDKFETFALVDGNKVYLGASGKIHTWNPKEENGKCTSQTLFNSKGKEDKSQVTLLQTNGVYIVAGTKNGNVFTCKTSNSSVWDHIGSHKAKVSN